MVDVGLLPAALCIADGVHHPEIEDGLGGALDPSRVGEFESELASDPVDRLHRPRADADASPTVLRVVDPVRVFGVLLVSHPATRPPLCRWHSRQHDRYT
ncbi:MAG: hypothetical protein ACI82G_003010 [Bradymonadia bacterium]|jgi:hypothetical protein